MTESHLQQSDFALFNLGFRPFFLGAALYAVISVGMWLLIYTFNISFPLSGLTAFQWHAHEMSFGYTLAVIAGLIVASGWPVCSGCGWRREVYLLRRPG